MESVDEVVSAVPKNEIVVGVVEGDHCRTSSPAYNSLTPRGVLSHLV